MKNNINNQSVIPVLTRLQRLTNLYVSLDTPLKILQILSIGTLSTALVGIVLSKFDNLPTNIYYIVLGLTFILGCYIGHHWEKGIQKLFEEVSRTIVNREFDNNAVIGVTALSSVIVLVMVTISIGGSKFGSVDIAAVGARLTTNKQDTKALQDSIQQNTKETDRYYSEQIAAIEADKQKELKKSNKEHDKKIKKLAVAAYSAKKRGDEKGYTWLIGSQTNEAMTAKTKAQDKITAKYDARIDKILALKNDEIQKNNDIGHKAVKAAFKANDKEEQEEEERKNRYQFGLQWIVVIASPLILFIIFLRSTIERAAGKISENDLPDPPKSVQKTKRTKSTVQQPTKKRTANPVQPENGNGTIENQPLAPSDTFAHIGKDGQVQYLTIGTIKSRIKLYTTRANEVEESVQQARRQGERQDVIDKLNNRFEKHFETLQYWINAKKKLEEKEPTI